MSQSPTLVVIGGPCTQQELDTYAYLSLVPPEKVLHTEVLQHFGPQDGNFCADPFCLPEEIRPTDVCALLLVGKDGQKIELAQCPPLGVTCNVANQTCIEMTGWCVDAPCCIEPVAFENLSACAKIPILKAQMMKLATCAVASSINTGDAQVSLKGASTDFIEKMLRICEAECYKCDPCRKPTRCFTVRGIGVAR